MTKQVIVVVHGVGVKQAGVSSDLLAAALQADDGQGAETRLPPHSSDDYVLLESRDYDTSNKASVFPARVRRYRSYDNGSVKDERVLADFFWGDVTAFGTGAVNIVFAYFRVAMGLSHAIRENAKDVYPGDNWEDRLIRRLARGAALTIHGPVIALNIVILLGLLLAAVTAYLIEGFATADNLLRVQIVVIGLLAIGGGGLALLLLGGSFLTRHLIGWIALSGLAFCFLGFPELFCSDQTCEWIHSVLAHLMCSVIPYNRDIFAVGLRMTMLLTAAWLMVFFQVIAVCAFGLVRWVRVGRPQTPNLIAPAIGLMSLLWFLLCAALWAAVLKLPAAFNLKVTEEDVTAQLNTIIAALIVLGLLIVAAAMVLFRKRELKHDKFLDPQAYMADSGANAAEYANRYRLLIAPGMLTVLCIFLPLVVAIAVLVCVPSGADLQRFLAEWTITIMFLILAAGSTLVYTLNAEFSAGIGILADVLAYLNNKSWKSGDAKDIYKTEESTMRTWLERVLERVLRAKTNGVATNANPRGYWLRRRIHDRLDVLVRSLIRDEAPDRLDIVSHSQGTVIAIDLIDRCGRDWLKQLRKADGDRPMSLVTMGSPYTHLYGHYFPASFPPVAQRPVLRQPDPLRPGDEAVLSAWLNIFRIDDFVGTHIGKGDWPKEFPVAPNGHTNYWIDRSVVEKLRDFLKF